jgi:hypothetical protein
LVLLSQPLAAGRASEPHQVWQMDAVECLRLLDGSAACWLRLTDECSGAILATSVFPHYRWSTVPLGQVQQAIRAAFGRWGCPGWLRVDNGIPWGRPGGLPSALSLWAAGLGVRMHWNDQYRPRQNAVVESTQGVSQRWVAPSGCAGLEELCRRVQEEDFIQRERYPAVGGLSRRQAYPGLLHSGRGYTRTWEGWVWDLGEALRFLGRFRVRRKVSCVGQVSVYHRLIRAFDVKQAQGGAAGTWVYVGLDPDAVEWVVSDVGGKELRRQAAPQLTRQAVLDLEFPRP